MSPYFLLPLLRSPLADRARLVSPSQLGNELFVPVNGAAALGTGVVFEELTPTADVMPAENLFIRGHGHPGRHMLNGGNGKVPDLLEKRHILISGQARGRGMGGLGGTAWSLQDLAVLSVLLCAGHQEIVRVEVVES